MPLENKQKPLCNFVSADTLKCACLHKNPLSVG